MDYIHLMNILKICHASDFPTIFVLFFFCMTAPLLVCAIIITHDCASILDSIAKVVSTLFAHGASHPFIPIHSIE